MIDEIINSPGFVGGAATAVGALGGIGLTHLLNRGGQKKDHNKDIVVQSTIDHKNKILDCATKILTLTHPMQNRCPISSTKGLAAKNPELEYYFQSTSKDQLLEACSQLELLISAGHEDNLEIVNTMRCLVKFFF